MALITAVKSYREEAQQQQQQEQPLQQH